LKFYKFTTHSFVVCIYVYLSCYLTDVLIKQLKISISIDTTRQVFLCYISDVPG